MRPARSRPMTTARVPAAAAGAGPAAAGPGPATRTVRPKPGDAPASPDADAGPLRHRSADPGQDQPETQRPRASRTRSRRASAAKDSAGRSGGRGIRRARRGRRAGGCRRDADSADRQDGETGAVRRRRRKRRRGSAEGAAGPSSPPMTRRTPWSTSASRTAPPASRRPRRRAVGQGIHQARGQEAAAPRGPGDRPSPAADHHRVRVPGPPRVGRADHGGPPAQGPHPDRGAGRRRAGRALREPVQPPVLRGQRLPGQGAERPAVHGGRVRRRRQGPQCGALRRRGQLRRQRPGGPAQADRVRAQGRPVADRAGHQGSGRAQGRPADQPDQPARPVPGLRARRVHDRHQPQAARHRAEPAQADPEEGHAGGRRRHRPHRGRGRGRGRAGPRRGPARRPVGGDREEGQDGQRARAALQRARPDHPGHQGRVQRGLQPT